MSCRMAGWGAVTATELFEIVVEDTDDGQRVSVRAANGRFATIETPPLYTAGMLLAKLNRDAGRVSSCRQRQVC